MAKKFFSYDKTTGLLVTTAEEEGRIYFGYEQDVQPHLDFAAKIRNERTQDNGSFSHVAFVPDSVILKMRYEDGVNFYDKEQRKLVMQLLQTKYPACKTTHKRIA